MSRKAPRDRRQKHERIAKEFQAQRMTLREIQKKDSAPLKAYQMLQELVAALRRRRKKEGLSLDAVAGTSGLDKGYLSRLENGKVINPTFETLYRYVAAIRPIRSVKDLATAGVDA
jgi:hypothetical protein